MYLFIFSYCCSMFAIIHRSMAWIYNCKCVHLDERRSRRKFLEESNESHNHSIFNSLQMTFKSNNALHIIEKIHVWTWKPKMALHLNQQSNTFFFNYIFALLVLETLTTSSQDEPPFMYRTHDKFTQCVQRKNDIQETFEKWIHQHILLQLLYY